MRKNHLKGTGETRTETFRGRLSPTELAQVKTAQKEVGQKSVSDLLMDGVEALGKLENVQNILRDEMGGWYAVDALYLPTPLCGWGKLRDAIG